MVKPVYVPEAGGIIDFPDDATPQEIVAYVDATYGAPKAAVPAPAGPDESGIFSRFGYGLATKGLTDIPGGIASLFYPAEEVSKTSAGAFSEEARKYLQEKLGIDPTKDPTAAQQAAEALGSVAGFLIPGIGAVKGVSLVGKGAAALRGVEAAAGASTAAEAAASAAAAARLANATGTVTTALQGAAIGASDRTQKIQQQLAAGMEITPEQQLAAQRWDAIIGTSEAAPLGKFFGPLEVLLKKVPASSAPIVERIIQSRLARIGRAGLDEGAQEVAAGIANDLVEYGVYNPNVEIGQDLLSNAGTGAFAGSFVEGVIQLAAGRKLRPYRQLQKDLAQEGSANFEADRQGRISTAAEALRQYGVEGAVNVDQEEIDGLPKFTIKSKAGNVFGAFDNEADATEAVDRYVANTGAKAFVVPKVQAPDVFPVKINGKRFGGIDEIVAERDTLSAQRDAKSKFATDPEALKNEAAAKKVSEPFYRSTVLKEVENITKKINKLDDFVKAATVSQKVTAPPPPVAAPTVSTEAPPAAAPVGSVEAPETPAVAAEAVAPTPLTEETVPPIGAVELPVEEQRYIEEAPVVDATKEIAAPVGRTEMRPSADSDQLDALKQELFGQVMNIKDMTPEQRSTYEAERDKRFPPQPTTVYYDAGRIRGAEATPISGTPIEPAAPRSIKEADVAGPNVRDYTPETAKWFEDVYAGVKQRIADIAPPAVQAHFQTMIDKGPNYLIRGQYRTEGEGVNAKSFIDLATGILRPGMSVEAAVKELVATVNHEAIHALRNMGHFRPAEWSLLSKAVANTKVPGKSYTYLNKAEAVYTPNGEPISEEYANPDSVVEEAVAEMYKDWVNNQKAPIQTRGLFNRVTEFFRRIFRVLKSAKYEGVFKGIESGEVARRAPDAAVATAGARFSTAPIADPEEFRKWFGNSKLVNPDGTPLKLYTGTSKDKIFTSFQEKDRGTWVTSDPEGASEYALFNDSMSSRPGPGWTFTPVNSASRVIPLYGRAENILDLSTREKQDEYYAANRIPRIDGANGYMKEQAAVGRAAKAQGYDAIQWAPNVWAIFNPNALKSQFNQFPEGEAKSKKFSAAPLPGYVEQKNRTLFSPQPDVPFYKSVFDFFFGYPTTGKTLRTMYGNIDVSAATRFATSARVGAVDNAAYVEYLEKMANLKSTGNFERREADYSAVAALAWNRRAPQLTVSTVLLGKPVVKFARPGDIQSATIAAEEDPDSLKKIFEILLQPGPTDSVSGVQKDKREVFKSYATAMRAIGLKAEGKPVPAELDNTYINTTISFTQANYPEVVDAYNMYQRFNKNLLTAAKDAGYISDQELSNLTRKMNYYGFYREVFEEELVPGVPSKVAAKVDLREYRGSQYGNLINDPMFVMLQNTQFWMSAIAKNLAASKTFNLARDMGEARLLGTSEKPDPSLGESADVMFFKQNGVLKRFAVSDPMLVSALGSTDTADIGAAMRLMGLPTKVIRETVTRDPAFMIANLLRDTVSSWITSGEDITPFIGTAKGFVSALKGSSSFTALMGRGVVGSYDMAMQGPAEMAATLRRRLMPKNIHTIASPDGLMRIIPTLWDRLGVLSEASDAATRIAVYEAARKQGLSEAEATFRAIQIMDFSRRGGSQTINLLTKLIPFLNARIQGLDVLYQAGRAGVRTVMGKPLGAQDAQLGKKFLVRGAMLAAISVLLEMMNEDDEDYKEVQDYIKNSNVLVPLKDFGLKGQFLAIPKPFESGLLFSTLPQQFWKTMSGDASQRDNLNLFFSSFGSTFGFNPIPQIIKPALEVMTNHDFYTGLPIVSEGKARLAPELQYDSRTSSLAMMISGIPITYNFDTGRFEGVSPAAIDHLIGGYFGPFGTLMVTGTGYAMEGFNAGPERMPRDLSQMPVVKRFFIDAESRNPKAVAQAYELFRIVDEANRSFSRLRQIGDAEAIRDFLDENRNVLGYKKYVYKLVDRLNKISAYERQVERDESMSREEKEDAQKRIREMRVSLTSRIGDINASLGR